METDITTEMTIAEALDIVMSGASRQREQEQPPTETEIAAQILAMDNAGYQAYYIEAFKALATWRAQYYKHGQSRKGLIITGDVGTGKTLFAKTMRMKIRTASELCEAFKSVNGMINGLFWYDSYGIFEGEHWKHDICIDELGGEPVMSHYGTSSEFMADLISARYNAWQKSGCITLITSNLSATEINKRYGRRITDRLHEMAVHVNISGKSMRGAR